MHRTIYTAPMPSMRVFISLILAMCVVLGIAFSSLADTVTGVSDNTRSSLDQMQTDARIIYRGDINELYTSLGKTTCDMSSSDAVVKVNAALGAVNDAYANTNIVYFTACGTVTTQYLGAGERLGVVDSYRNAFVHVPQTQDQWNDVIKIANGRFPSDTNALAEDNAKITFQTIYLRAPSMNDEHDRAAINIMAYGLRPWPRNTTSELAAIHIFMNIFHYAPKSAVDWDAVRAIAYSGASRR